MSAVVFCGPSISAAEVREMFPEATPLGPAACGDLYEAARRRPRAIVLCDGYFDHRLSVWHKEILWALAQGIAVYGAASMGALRAAELSAFGMRGVGRIFEQFRDGALEDDDEVAVVHESSERAFRPISEALVNLRSTLDCAVREQILRQESAAQLIQELRGLFYPERSYRALLALAPKAGLSQLELASLEQWLSRVPPINQKHLDALLAVERARDDLADVSRAASQAAVRFHFEHTEAWHALKTKLDQEHGASWRRAVRAAGCEEALELRVDALERSLALTLAAAENARPTADEVQRLSERFRVERGLFTTEQTADWLARHELDLEGFSVLMYDEVLVARYRERAQALAAAQAPSARRLLLAKAT